MKNLSFNLKRGGLIAAMCSFLIIAQTITAQSLLFVDTPTPPSEMTSGQLSRYNKLTAPGLFSELRVVQFNELATVEQQGPLTVNG